ncbi:MAG: hypothetical protein ABJ081_01245 [Hyphomicrobiales bacterium]
MFDIRHLNLTYRDHENIGNPKARKKELKKKLGWAIEYLRDDRPVGKDLREAIAELIEDYAFPKPGPKGSSICIVELGLRADQLSSEGKRPGEIDKILADEFGAGDKDDQSTVKRMRLDYEKVQEINSMFNSE